MGGINGDRCEQRLRSFCVKILNLYARGGPERAHRNYANRFREKKPDEIFAPAIVLSSYKFVDSSSKFAKHFARRAAIGAGVLDAVLHLLQKTSDAHFDKFVEIACGDGEEFHALEERVFCVACFFEDALVELQPGKMAIQK